MQLSSPERHWNELQFLSWREFTQMAPSIIQLEISRIGSIIDAPATNLDIRNVLVRARFELREFQECLQLADGPPLGDPCVAHLRTSILSLSIRNQIRDKETTITLDYVFDRLISMLERIDLIFQAD